MQIAQAFINDHLLKKAFIQSGYQIPELISGFYTPWRVNILGYRLTTFTEAKTGKEPVLCIGLSVNDELVGGYAIYWEYRVNGKKVLAGSLVYAKYINQWLGIGTPY